MYCDMKVFLYMILSVNQKRYQSIYLRFGWSEPERRILIFFSPSNGTRNAWDNDFDQNFSA